jgi:hypothetical protein
MQHRKRQRRLEEIEALAITGTEIAQAGERIGATHSARFIWPASLRLLHSGGRHTSGR